MHSHSASERSVGYVFLMRARVANHYLTHPFRTVSKATSKKLSEKGYEQRSEREFGRYTEEEMGPWVVCRATLQALSTLFGQSQKVCSAKFRPHGGMHHTALDGIA